MKQLWLVTLFCLASGGAYAEIKRTESGKPDLSGFYDSGTLTPLNRPEELGEKQFMTREEADKITGRAEASGRQTTRPVILIEKRRSWVGAPLKPVVVAVPVATILSGWISAMMS